MSDDVELEEVVALRECRAELEHLQVEYDTLDAHHHRYANWAAREWLRSEKRGTSYRARALALLGQCHHLRHWDDLTPKEEIEIAKRLAEYEAGKDDPYQVLGVYRSQIDEWQSQAAELTVAREHASISLARSASDGLAKEAAMALLRTARQWHGHAADCLASVIAPSNDGFVDMEACDCGWRELAAEIDAALDARDPQAAHSAHSDTDDAVTAVGERKDE